MFDIQLNLADIGADVNLWDVIPWQVPLVSR